jgi:hypothetical protein
MKIRSLIVLSVVPFLFACADPEPDPIDVIDIEQAHASINWSSPPAKIDGPTVVGLGVSKIPPEVLNKPISVSPPGEGERHVYNKTMK